MLALIIKAFLNIQVLIILSILVLLTFLLIKYNITFAKLWIGDLDILLYQYDQSHNTDSTMNNKKKKKKKNQIVKFSDGIFAIMDTVDYPKLPQWDYYDYLVFFSVFGIFGFYALVLSDCITGHDSASDFTWLPLTMLLVLWFIMYRTIVKHGYLSYETLLSVGASIATLFLILMIFYVDLDIYFDRSIKQDYLWFHEEVNTRLKKLKNVDANVQFPPVLNIIYGILSIVAALISLVFFLPAQQYAHSYHLITSGIATEQQIKKPSRQFPLHKQTLEHVAFLWPLIVVLFWIPNLAKNVLQLDDVIFVRLRLLIMLAGIILRILIARQHMMCFVQTFQPIYERLYSLPTEQVSDERKSELMAQTTYNNALYFPTICIYETGWICFSFISIILYQSYEKIDCQICNLIFGSEGRISSYSNIHERLTDNPLLFTPFYNSLMPSVIVFTIFWSHAMWFLYTCFFLIYHRYIKNINS